MLDVSGMDEAEAATKAMADLDKMYDQYLQTSVAGDLHPDVKTMKANGFDSASAQVMLLSSGDSLF